jgi:ferric-dicitrate binding protein FerR (iron transport regulator)
MITAFVLRPDAALAAVNSDNSASVMRLEKTVGDVKVVDSAGKASQIIEKMRLGSGDDVASAAKSYAFISLDDSKVVKLDANSEAVVKKNNKNYELVLEAGNLLFNVDSPLKSDEGFEIKSATMTMGIRGTFAQVQRKSADTTDICLLEGSLSCTLTDPKSGKTQSIVLKPGDYAVFSTSSAYQEGGQIITRRATVDDLRGFTLQYIVDHQEVAQKIYEQSGIDLRSLTRQQADERLLRDESGQITEIYDGRTSPTADWYLGDH